MIKILICVILQEIRVQCRLSRWRCRCRWPAFRCWCCYCGVPSWLLQLLQGLIEWVRVSKRAEAERDTGESISTPVSAAAQGNKSASKDWRRGSERESEIVQGQVGCKGHEIQGQLLFIASSSMRPVWREAFWTSSRCCCRGFRRESTMPRLASWVEPEPLPKWSNPKWWVTFSGIY